MTFFQALILGFVQGATEFLPISSSAHLVLLPWIFGWELDRETVLIFDILVHWGTLAAVILYFRSDLKAILIDWSSGLLARQPFRTKNAKLGWLILATTVPALIVGSLARQFIELALTTPVIVSIFLLVNAAVMIVAERLASHQRTLKSMKLGDSLWIGIAQIFALFPGISRSGATISAGLLRGFKREDAARFAFLISIPITLAAGMLAMYDLVQMPDRANQFPILLIGFLTAAVVGYVALRWLLHYLVYHPLTIFSIYCTVIGLGSLLLYAIQL